MTVHAIKKFVRLVFFPPFCMSCGIAAELLCCDCAAKIKPVSSPHCPRCHLPIFGEENHECHSCRHTQPQYDDHRSLVLYDDSSRKLIHQFKYQENHAVKRLLKSWLQKWQNDTNDVDLIVAVPLLPKKLKQRGFNQSHEIAKILGRMWKKPVQRQLLERVKQNADQVGRTRDDRIKNIKGNFVVRRPEMVIGKKVLLVDDVHTTGATLNEVARVLKKAGAKKVFARTIAMVE